MKDDYKNNILNNLIKKEELLKRKEKLEQELKEIELMIKDLEEGK